MHCHLFLQLRVREPSGHHGGKTSIHSFPQLRRATGDRQHVAILRKDVPDSISHRDCRRPPNTNQPGWIHRRLSPSRGYSRTRRLRVGNQKRQPRCQSIRALEQHMVRSGVGKRAHASIDRRGLRRHRATPGQRGSASRGGGTWRVDYRVSFLDEILRQKRVFNGQQLELGSVHDRSSEKNPGRRMGRVELLGRHGRQYPNAWSATTCRSPPHSRCSQSLWNR